MSDTPLSVAISAGSETIRLTKTGPATAELVEADAAGTNTYQLGNVVRTATGLEADITGMWFVTPHVQLIVGIGFVRLIVTNAWTSNGDTTYPVPSKDIGDLNDFIAAAQFPTTAAVSQRGFFTRLFKR